MESTANEGSEAQIKIFKLPVGKKNFMTPIRDDTYNRPLDLYLWSLHLGELEQAKPPINEMP
jgi:hypothetical protein